MTPFGVEPISNRVAAGCLAVQLWCRERVSPAGFEPALRPSQGRVPDRYTTTTIVSRVERCPPCRGGARRCVRQHSWNAWTRNRTRNALFEAGYDDPFYHRGFGAEGGGMELSSPFPETHFSGMVRPTDIRLPSGATWIGLAMGAMRTRFPHEGTADVMGMEHRRASNHSRGRHCIDAGDQRGKMKNKSLCQSLISIASDARLS